MVVYVFALAAGLSLSARAELPTHFVAIHEDKAFVAPSSGKWKTIVPATLLAKPESLTPAPTYQPKARVAQDQTVEKTVHGTWVPTKLRAPPAGIRYESAVQGTDGSVLVKLADGLGFNFIRADGQVIVSSKQVWADTTIPPPLREYVPMERGFLGTDAENRVWHVSFSSETGHFQAKLATQLGLAAEIVRHGSSVLLRGTPDQPDYRIVHSLNEATPLGGKAVPAEAEIFPLNAETVSLVRDKLRDAALRKSIKPFGEVNANA